MDPIYPQIHVRSRSPNPLVLVAAIREGLRRAHASREEIRRFSAQALAASDPGQVREVCRRWAAVDG